MSFIRRYSATFKGINLLKNDIRGFDLLLNDIKEKILHLLIVIQNFFVTCGE